MVAVVDYNFFKVLQVETDAVVCVVGGGVGAVFGVGVGVVEGRFETG